VCTIRVVLEKGGGRPRLTNMLGAIDLKRSIGKWGLVIAMPVLKKTYRHYTYFQGDKTSVAFACFECRKVFKRRVTLRPSVKPQICSQCGTRMWLTGTAFKAPHQEDSKQWRKAEKLIRSGVLFWPNAGYRPAMLREVEPFLKRALRKSRGENLLSRIANRNAKRSPFDGGA